MQYDGNLCLNYSAGGYVYCTGTFGQPIASARMEPGGNFCLELSTGGTTMCSNTLGHPNAVLLVKNGSFGVYDGEISLWSRP